MHEFVLELARQLIRYRCEALYRHANPHVIASRGPRWRLSDVVESLLRIKDDSDRFCRSETQHGLNAAEVLFESAENFRRKLRSSLTLVTEIEMTAVRFVRFTFSRLVALSLFDHRLQLLRRLDTLRGLPLFDGLVDLVHAVVSPTGELCYRCC